MADNYVSWRNCSKHTVGGATLYGFQIASSRYIYNALNSNDQDSLNFAAGVPALPPKQVSSDVAAELKDWFRALFSTERTKPQLSPPLKSGEQCCVTCGGDSTSDSGTLFLLQISLLFGDSDFLLIEEADSFLALEDDPTSSEVDPTYQDPEGDILLLEAILNSEPPPPSQIKELISAGVRERTQNSVEDKSLNLR
ncbi:hypothetical protein Tco_0102986 [Tanacetum coccineum]